VRLKSAPGERTSAGKLDERDHARIALAIGRMRKALHSGSRTQSLHTECILALTGNASKAAHTIASGVTALRTAGSTYWIPSFFAFLAKAYADFGLMTLGAVLVKPPAATATLVSRRRWVKSVISDL
jgi:hypothetical protein